MASLKDLLSDYLGKDGSENDGENKQDLLNAGVSIAGDTLGAFTNRGKYQGATKGKSIGGAVGGIGGALFGPAGAKVGQMLGSTVGGMIGGANDQNKMIEDYETTMRRKNSKLDLSANVNPYGVDNTFYMQDGGIVDGGDKPTIDKDGYKAAKTDYYRLLQREGRNLKMDKYDQKSMREAHGILRSNAKYYEPGGKWNLDPLKDAAFQMGNTLRSWGNQAMGTHFADGGLVGGDPDPKTQQAKIPTANDLNYVNSHVKDFSVRRGLVIGDNAHTGGQIPKVTYQGKEIPFGTPVLEPEKTYRPVDRNATEVYTQGSDAYYVDPRSGDYVPMDMRDINRPQFKKTNVQPTGSIAKMEYGGLAGYDDPITPKQSAAKIPTASDISYANSHVKDFSQRHNMLIGQDAHSGGTVPKVTLDGKQIPFGAPMLEPDRTYRPVPKNATDFHVQKSEAYYQDPKSGDFVPMPMSAIHNQQFRQKSVVPTMADGGLAPDQEEDPFDMVNIEKGELLIDANSMDIIRDFDNKNRYKKHSTAMINENIGNFVMIPKGAVVISKKFAKSYKEGDALARKSIVLQILKDQEQNPETRAPKMAGGGLANPDDPFAPYLDEARALGDQYGDMQAAAYDILYNGNPINIPLTDEHSVYTTDPSGRQTLSTGPQNIPQGTRQAPVTNMSGFQVPGIEGQAAGTEQEQYNVEGNKDNLSLMAARALNFLPTAYGLSNAMKMDPFLKYDENDQFNNAISYVQDIETQPNIEASKAAIRRSNANANKMANNINSPSVRAETAFRHGQGLEAEGNLIQNATNMAMDARNKKRQTLAGLQQAQGQHRLDMRQKLMEDLRMDSANRDMMVQQGLSEGVVNYGRHVMDNEKIKAVNTMTEFYKLDPTKQQMMIDQGLFSEEFVSKLGGLFGNITGGTGTYQPYTKTQSVTRDGVGNVRRSTTRKTDKAR